jgi:sugar phosphate isomerase/epimerase
MDAWNGWVSRGNAPAANVPRAQAFKKFDQGSGSMLRASISERTTFRWDLAEELEALQHYGFDAVSVWRPKLSDLERGEARRLLDAARVRVSSLQWAGGFTGCEGQTLRESIDDARLAIHQAAELGTGVLLVHTGCRAGHTLGHARRLVQESIETLVPLAEELAVRLALKPTHPSASAGCGLFTRLDEIATFVDEIDHPSVGLALDLWHFGNQSDLLTMLPDLLQQILVVSVADCQGQPTADHERLPPGDGTVPLAHIMHALSAAGFDGDIEFEFLAEPREVSADRPLPAFTSRHAEPCVSAGYFEALKRARRAARHYGCTTRPSRRAFSTSSPTARS